MVAEQQNSPPQSAGLEIAQAVWRRRKWPGIVVFAWVFTAAVSVVMFLPNVYRSGATVLVERQKVPEAFVQSTVTSGIDDRLQSITQQILSRSRLQDLINRFNLYPEMRQSQPLETVLGRMRQDIQLQTKQGQLQGRSRERVTTAFTISYHGKDPQVVAQVANALASFYIEENLKVREQQAAGTSEFLQAQLEKVKTDLEARERQLSQFRERYIGELPEQLGANLAALERLNAQLSLNSQNQARVGEQRAELVRQLAEPEGVGTSTGPAGTAKFETDAMRLKRLQQELTVLLTRFGDKYPDVVQRKSEIAALEQRLAETADGKTPRQAPPVNPYVQQLRNQLGTLNADYKALQTQERSLQETITQYQQRVENTPRREQELNVLLRGYKTTKDLYESLLKRQEEAKLSESLEQRQKGEQFRLLEPATPSARPAEPNRRKLALVGLMAACGLAAGTMLLLEALDTSFHTVDDLQAFSQVPVLVSLPYLTTPAETRRRRWRFGLLTVLAIVVLGVIVAGSYVAIKGPSELTGLIAQMQRLRP